MKPRSLYGLVLLLALLLALSPAYAQTSPPSPGNIYATQQQLDQMLAPIALYPDSLLSQILMASTYPLEVVEAAHWSAANPNLQGDQAVSAVEQNNWDPSVKSLVAFPQILRMMEEQLDWTERLGDAFLAQQAQVMDTVQSLRRKAQAAGNLQSGGEVVVRPEGQLIVIEPVNPEFVYVPYYDPMVVYGTWWWADYPPVYWAPWPGYYWRPGFAPGFSWGVGITVGSGFFFGVFDWAHHRIDVEPHYRGRRVAPRTVAPQVWRHDPTHRRGVPYGGAAPRPQPGRVSPPPDLHRDFRGYNPPAVRQPAVPRPAAPQPMVPRPGVRPDAGRAISGPGVERRPPAFEGVGQGRDVRSSSQRGRESYRESAPRIAPPSGSALPARSAPGRAAAPRPGTPASARPAGKARDARPQR